MAFNPKDHYFKKAKKEGFLARSAYKLEEIQHRHKIINKNDRILDLGCAPGAWSQMCLKIIGPRGFVEGVDLKPTGLSAANARFQVKDAFTLTEEDFLQVPFDVVISDMAPSTTGVVFRDQVLSEELCAHILDILPRFLKQGGNFTMKLFMGPGYKELELRTRKMFQMVKTVRPDSTRKSSKEVFVVAKGFKAP